MYENYLPVLGKYVYHRHYVILLRKHKTAADRKNDLISGDMETMRNYAERLSFELNK